jgi:ketosteroid isomerase-like protein
MPGSAPRSAEPSAVAEAFLGAYNEKDFDVLGELFAEDVDLVHYNRPVAASGREAVLAMFRASAAPEGSFPDRRFLPPRRRIAAGEHVLLEHVWEATARQDVPGMGRKGERVRIELATILTVADGRITLYEEYG